MIGALVAFMLTCQALTQPYAYYFSVESGEEVNISHILPCRGVGDFTACYIDGYYAVFTPDRKEMRIQTKSTFEPYDSPKISVNLKKFSCYYPIRCERSENGRIFITYQQGNNSLEIFVDNSTGDMKIIKQKFSGDVAFLAKKLAINGAKVVIETGREIAKENKIVEDPIKVMEKLRRLGVVSAYKSGGYFSVCRPIDFEVERREVLNKSADLTVIGVLLILIIVTAIAYIKLSEF